MQPHFCPSSGIYIYGRLNLGHRSDETLAGCAAGLYYGPNWFSVSTLSGLGCAKLIIFNLFIIRSL